MDALMKYSGIILVLISFILLIVYMVAGLTSNAVLLVSGILSFAGLMGYILTNKYLK